MPLEIIPSIDLRNGRVVRLQQGDYARQLNYDVDPLEQARGYARAGARWLHIVDLDGAREGRPVQVDLIAKIAAGCSMHVEAGGGIRSSDDVYRLMDAGIQRVVVGTKAIEDWPWFTGLVAEPRCKGRIVLALDAKDGIVATRGWTHASGKMAAAIAAEVSAWPLAAILYTDVAKDGLLQGPNLEHTRLLAEAGRVPVIASGGVANLDHVRQLTQLPIWAAIVGRSLYEGTLNLADAIAISSGKTSP